MTPDVRTPGAIGRFGSSVRDFAVALIGCASLSAKGIPHFRNRSVVPVAFSCS
jgi:hypothetical protein